MSFLYKVGELGEMRYSSKGDLGDEEDERWFGFYLYKKQPEPPSSLPLCSLKETEEICVRAYGF